MSKKGKFNLATFQVEKNQIFYVSLNKPRKIVSLSIITVEDVFSVIPILNNFLMKGFIEYFSIHLEIKNGVDKTVLIAMIDKDKDRITSSLELIRSQLTTQNNKITFLEGEKLKDQYLNIGFGNFECKVKFLNSNKLIRVSNGDNQHYLSFYQLNLTLGFKKRINIGNFLEYLNKINVHGDLIFNMKKESSGEVVMSGYFIELNKTIEDQIDLHDEINTFFGYELIIKQKCSPKQIGKLIWRTQIFPEKVSYNKIELLFLKENESNLEIVTNKLVNLLEKNKIKFHCLNKNMIFIQEQVLFLIFDKLDAELIESILEKYYLKYKIFILVLDSDEQSKISKLEDNVELINLKFFQQNDLLNENLINTLLTECYN